MKAWGVYFSRNAETGLKRAAADFYPEQSQHKVPLIALQQIAPEAVEKLQTLAAQQEQVMRQAVQTRFYIEQGELQVEPFQPLVCTAQAAVRIAVQMVAEGVISPAQAVGHIQPDLLRQFFQGRLKHDQKHIIGQGKGNGMGICCGRVALDQDNCLDLYSQGFPVILLLDYLTCSHRNALEMASGVILKQGNSLAVDQLHKPCVIIPLEGIPSEQWISLDAGSGQVFAQALDIKSAKPGSEIITLLNWADALKSLEIRANVSNQEELKLALQWGASAVGLFRIESLVLQENNLNLFQTCLRQICHQRLNSSPQISQWVQVLSSGLRELFKLCGERHFNLRLLDAPVGLMLRHWQENNSVAHDYWAGPLDAWKQELNPIQGLRCSRVSQLFPCLWQAQLQACLQASQDLPVKLQITLPGVCHVAEVRRLRQFCQQVCQQEGCKMPQIGCMLELPRACLTADQLAQEVDFLTFGTGDLSESTCGISRYDAALSFLPSYLEQGIFSQDPFQAIDQDGVGALMGIAMEKIQPFRSRIEVGTCGAQAVDPGSLKFCIQLGLDYVSVPPEYLAVARLAAAQAAIQEQN